MRHLLTWALVAAALAAARAARACPVDQAYFSAEAYLERVVDGDTFDAVAAHWPGHTVFGRFRLLGVDTPELGAADAATRMRAQAAKAYVERRLGEGTFSLCVTKPDAFGRYLAKAYVRGEDLGAALLELGLAVPFKR